MARGSRQASWEIAGGVGERVFQSWRTERSFKSPAARREQCLRKDATLMWLETGQRGKGEGGGARWGVTLRALYFL